LLGIQGLPVLQIFSGFTSHDEWVPIGNKVLMVYKAMNCAPCWKASHAECPYGSACMAQIDPNIVFDAFKKLKAIFIS
jgi:hypothetical protein